MSVEAESELQICDIVTESRVGKVSERERINHVFVQYYILFQTMKVSLIPVQLGTKIMNCRSNDSCPHFIP